MSDTRPPEVDSTAVILAAISALRDQVGSLRTDMDDQIGSLRRELRDTDQRLTGQIGEQAGALTQVAKAAATAANMALEAKQTANESQGHARSMIESAIRIHNSSISSTVDAAVKKAVGKTNEAIGAIVDELGIEDRVELGRLVKPGEPKPVRTLTKVSRESKAAALGGALAFVITAIEIAIKLLGH